MFLLSLNAHILYYYILRRETHTHITKKKIIIIIIILYMNVKHEHYLRMPNANLYSTQV